MRHYGSYCFDRSCLMSDQTPDPATSTAAVAELQQLLLATDNIDDFLQQLAHLTTAMLPDGLIAAKQAEIDDANSIFSQLKAYFTGMTSSVSSIVDIGKSTSEGYTSVSTSGVGEALGHVGQSAAGAAAASESATRIHPSAENGWRGP
jgi:hypothetical protein